MFEGPVPDVGEVGEPAMLAVPVPGLVLAVAVALDEALVPAAPVLPVAFEAPAVPVLPVAFEAPAVPAPAEPTLAWPLVVGVTVLLLFLSLLGAGAEFWMTLGWLGVLPKS